MATADPEPLTDEAAAGIVSVLHRHGVRFIVIGGITRLGPLDISLKPSGTDGYHDLLVLAVEFSLAGTAVPTASLDDIIRSKTAAGRAKDNLALPALLRHLRRRPQ